MSGAVDADQAKTAATGGSLWGGRFQGGLDPLFERVNQSLPFDLRLLADDVVGSRAYARALGAAGVLGADEVERLVAALDDVARSAAEDPARVLASGAEDVH